MLNALKSEQTVLCLLPFTVKLRGKHALMKRVFVPFLLAFLRFVLRLPEVDLYRKTVDRLPVRLVYKRGLSLNESTILTRSLHKLLKKPLTYRGGLSCV